jgi:hypothetical protein
VKPVPRRALGRRIGGGMVGGTIVTIVLLVAVVGIRPDLNQAIHGFAFWIKLTYAASLGIGAVIAVMRLARPTGLSLHGFWLLLVPVVVLAGIGVTELAATPSEGWLAMWLGDNWQSCPWLVLALSMPIFAGLLWSFRSLAPTRLHAAGGAAGLAAGAWAATIYCFHCPEASALFMLTWDSLGILLAAVIGMLIGPRLMRW